MDVQETKQYRYTTAEICGDLVLARRTNASVTFEVARTTIAPAPTDDARIAVPDTEVYPVEAELGTSLWRFNTSHAATRLLMGL